LLTKTSKQLKIIKSSTYSSLRTKLFIKNVRLAGLQPTPAPIVLHEARLLT